jgi:hypothetical protein
VSDAGRLDLDTLPGAGIFAASDASSARLAEKSGRRRSSASLFFSLQPATDIANTSAQAHGAIRGEIVTARRAFP